MGVSLSLAKFNSILKVDPVARTAVVQCGVRNLAISEAAAPYGLYYAPDPSSQIACTIGGNVAENSGGVHCLKYGLTLHNVLRVRGFTAQGQAIEFGSEAPDAAGLDLLPLVVGSEGMLAVIMEVTVRLLPRPVLARCVVASFATVESAGAAVAAVIAAGIIPAGLELMDKRMTAAAEDYVHAGYDLDAAAILLCESDGTPAEVEEEIQRTIDVLNANGATRIAISRDERQRLQFWSGRKNAFPASGRMSPDYMCMDSTIPRKRLAEMLRNIGEMEGKYALRCVNVFHAGDGNLHPLILFDANDPDEMRRCELFGAEILETSIKLGGTVTGEHGVGVEKLNSMCVQFSAAERAQFLAVKHAFDPLEVVTAITKSGTNQIHGSLFEFNRNTDLNDTPWNSTFNPPYHRNQFGGVVGGPVKRDKAFFLFSYGGLRQVVGQQLTGAVVPTAAEREGDFTADSFKVYMPGTAKTTKVQVDGTNSSPDCATAKPNCVPSNLLDPTAANIMSKYVPLPTNLANNSYSGFFVGPTNQNEYLGKYDQVVSDQDRASVSYFYLKTTVMPLAAATYLLRSTSLVPRSRS